MPSQPRAGTDIDMTHILQDRFSRANACLVSHAHQSGETSEAYTIQRAVSAHLERPHSHTVRSTSYNQIQDKYLFICGVYLVNNNNTKKSQFQTSKLRVTLYDRDNRGNIFVCR
jgi:hypothetical protein